MGNYSYSFKIKGLRPLFTQGASSLKVSHSTVKVPLVSKPRSGFNSQKERSKKRVAACKPRSGDFTSQKERSEKRVTACKPRSGQIMLEVLWLALFTCAFLAMLSHLYEAGKREIELSRSQPTMLHRGVKPSSSLKKAKKRSLFDYKKKFFH